MKFLSLIAVGFVTFTASAAIPGYELKMAVSLDGKKVASSQVTVKEGKPALLTQKTKKQETFIEVLALESPAKEMPGILMKFKIGKIVNGKQVILSTPQVIVKEDSPAHLTMDASKKSQALDLSITAKRTAL